MNVDDIGNFYEDAYIGTRAISIQATADYLRAKLQGIFSYENLPESLPHDVIESMLVTGGVGVIYQYGDELFITSECPSAKPDIYGRNTEVHITHGNERVTAVVGESAVLVKNDPMSLGLESLVNEYAVLTAQAKITLLRSFPMLRSHYILQAKDKDSYKAAVEYEASVRRGDMAVILAEEYDDMEGLVVHQTPPPTNATTQAIELYQYVQATYYGELGINLTNNMKREYVSDSEISRSTGMPLIHVMLTERERAVDKVNELFGTDISVHISNEWNRELNPEDDGYDEDGEPFDDGEVSEDVEEDVDESAESSDSDDSDEDGDGDSSDESGDGVESEEEVDEEDERS